MTTTDTAKDTTQTSDKLVITRTFDAPRELVWKAWTDPERMMRWWGPKGFTAPVIEIDFRVGGKYVYCMRSAEGQEFWSTGTYREIVARERIVLTESAADANGNVVPPTHYGMPDDIPLEGLLTLRFDDAAGKTKLTLSYAWKPTGEVLEMMTSGWNEAFDKLAASLK